MHFSTLTNLILPLTPLLFLPQTHASHLAIADQKSQTIRVFPRSAPSWTQSTIHWEFDPSGANSLFTSTNPWHDVSDVRIRKTAKHGWVALVAASRGMVGIVDIQKGRPRTGVQDVLWSAYTGGNPHAIERIPYVGGLVVASSQSHALTLYAPVGDGGVSDYARVRKVATYEVEGAHGVLWDPNGGEDPRDGFLWAIGKGYLYKYRVVGKGEDLRLERLAGKEGKIELPGTGARNGHDLSASYAHEELLLLTHTSAAYSYNKTSGEFEMLMNMTKLKSLVQDESGEYVWVRGAKNEMGQYVSFSEEGDPEVEEDKRGWGDAEFYKARIYDPAYY
ncbi:uncharacterized protein LDX57_011374 [Aspergillus melleus]|uniref:uncharacterized protein n=1 Tax=Aspergillus melleus TaxID=138277 RepID=UPI001E8E64FF|nr:uncharacterized protein LDX57_011374 [Aspergillus melleus]KAH8433740.1 hypothetical protein LDX57_011374 [Aspergillus melleus]